MKNLSHVEKYLPPHPPALIMTAPLAREGARPNLCRKFFTDISKYDRYLRE